MALYDIPASEEVELKKAERASRLAQLFISDVWKYDVLPILTAMHDDYLESVKSKQLDPDTLKVFDDLFVRLNGNLQLGVGAMTRMAQRRLAAAEKQPTT